RYQRIRPAAPAIQPRRFGHQALGRGPPAIHRDLWTARGPSLLRRNIMRTLMIATAALLSLGATLPARAALNVFACEPEWAALATEIGGDKVSTYAATTASQDPHQVQARPSLIARARNADMSICTGAELEIGWLPQIAMQTSNPKIQPGAATAMEAARFVSLLEVPSRLDRAQGDIHAAGNPH